MIKLSEAEITAGREIAARCSDTAYMAYAFSNGAYRRIAYFLLRHGFTPAQVEWVMQSKHIRWAYDSGNGEATSGTFERYFAAHEAQIRADLEKYSGDVAGYEERNS